jgi:hypothetical protein
MRICPDCQLLVDEAARFCDNCGYPLQSQDKLPPLPPQVNESARQPVGVSNAVAANLVAPGTCSACGYQNVPGEMFCQNCGVQLAPVPSVPPPPPRPVVVPAPEQPRQDVPHEPPAVAPAPPVKANQPAGVCLLCGYLNGPSDAFCQNCGAQLVPATAPFAAPTAPGKLIVREANVTIALPVGKSEILLGRSDPVRNIFPDVDLTPFGGEKAGVSRRHARLILQGFQLYLEDLNSTNFTFLNQQKLQSGQLYPVIPGDEIRVGLLAMDYLTI